MTEDIRNRIRMRKTTTRPLHGIIWKKKLKNKIFQLCSKCGTLWRRNGSYAKNIKDKMITVELEFLRISLQIIGEDKWRTERI